MDHGTNINGISFRSSRLIRSKVAPGLELDPIDNCPVDLLSFVSANIARIVDETRLYGFMAITKIDLSTMGTPLDFDCVEPSVSTEKWHFDKGPDRRIVILAHELTAHVSNREPTACTNKQALVDAMYECRELLSPAGCKFSDKSLHDAVTELYQALCRKEDECIIYYINQCHAYAWEKEEQVILNKFFDAVQKILEARSEVYIHRWNQRPGSALFILNETNRRDESRVVHCRIPGDTVEEESLLKRRYISEASPGEFSF